MKRFLLFAISALCLVVVYNSNGITGPTSLAGKYTEFKPETKAK